jgi:hypothetical protein
MAGPEPTEFEKSLPGWPKIIPEGHWVYSELCDSNEPNAMLGECEGKPCWFKFVVLPMRPLSDFEVDFLSAPGGIPECLS